MIIRNPENPMTLPVFPDIYFRKNWFKKRETDKPKASILLETHVRVQRKSDGKWFKVHVLETGSHCNEEQVENYIFLFMNQCWKCSAFFIVPEDDQLQLFSYPNPDAIVLDPDQRSEIERLNTINP
jgi:hypothetical protein